MYIVRRKTSNKKYKNKRRTLKTKKGGALREYYHYSNTSLNESNFKNISNEFLKTNLKFNFESNELANNNIPPNNTTFKEMTYGMKPGGLWLSKDTEWGNFMELEGHTYLYKAIIDDSNMLILDTVDKVKDFTEKYRVKTGNMFYVIINWKAVAREYDGVIFDNYNSTKINLMKNFSPQYIWFLGVDINSACTWRPNKTVKEWKLIKNKK
jgi:hypothetical protein